ncbi:OmpA family protein [Tunturibacter empetritectus]|uniref:Outer membrane protein OmpA-like peptidoglycan-associated protein n=1 Tax=Tunturiibacter lichenicola TaxID=2051959 RepID=A0A7W8J6I7_9BACT|nr:OmpA family protein [Edaphobacter lichenicola]MBB5343539.1 outer membrane protein OmpA-like peptidoglycan-associated protein [Edaphobacter lichenicola]
MMKSGSTFGLPALLLGSALGISAFAQSSTQTSTPATQTKDSTAANSTSGAINPDDKATYATGKPLTDQSKEGFWGHMNPFARKKWVSRQTAPIKDQVNELDQLQSKNANDIKDVDSRSQAGIKNAMSAANTADQHAQDAANRANSAQTLAGNASSRTDALGNTVGNLDQYQTVSSTSVKFASGRTALGPTGKSDLDNLATTLASEKGYIIEVQGYSRAGVQTSQAMADSVVRYLVTEHQVPVYRIYKTGLGKNTAKPADGEQAVVNGVRVTLLHNSLASMSSDSASSATATPKTSHAGVSSPQEVNQ